MTHHHVFKCVVCGDISVGKTSFLKQLCDREFSSQSKPTIGIDFHIFTHEDIKLQLWDTAGQEKYRALTKQYFQGAQIIFFMFDVTRPRTLASLQDVWASVTGWNSENGTSLHHPKCIAFVMGCKTDLPREVSTEAGQHIARLMNAAYLECSARNHQECVASIMKVVETLKRPDMMEMSKLLPSSYDAITLDSRTEDDDAEEDDPIKRNKCC